MKKKYKNNNKFHLSIKHNVNYLKGLASMSKEDLLKKIENLKDVALLLGIEECKKKQTLLINIYH